MSRGEVKCILIGTPWRAHSWVKHFCPWVPSSEEGLGLVLGLLARWDTRESSFVGRAFLPPGPVPPRRGRALLPKS
jgi:hypothetical protein